MKFIWYFLVLQCDFVEIFSTIPIPIYVKPNIQYREGSSGRFELTVGPKQTMGKTVRLLSAKETMFDLFFSKISLFSSKL